MNDSIEELRAKFEVWANSRCMDIHRCEDAAEYYGDYLTETRWEAFQACASLHLLGEESKQPAEHLAAPCSSISASERMPLACDRVGRMYLAGPMTGYAEYNFPAFHAAAAGLRAEGLQVVNPADHGVVEGADWADYLRYDMGKLALCESIVLMPGWSKSKCATLELHVANALGMPVRRLHGAED